MRRGACNKVMEGRRTGKHSLSRACPQSSSDKKSRGRQARCLASGRDLSPLHPAQSPRSSLRLVALLLSGRCDGTTVSKRHRPSRECSATRAAIDNAHGLARTRLPSVCRKGALGGPKGPSTRQEGLTAIAKPPTQVMTQIELSLVLGIPGSWFIFPKQVPM